jgi:hypothetical protein
MARSSVPQDAWRSRLTYVTTLMGNGEICPITERIGRRCVRRIEADSTEGRLLLQSGRVTVLTRAGRRFSGTPIFEVYDRLVDEMIQEASDPGTDPRARDSLSRLVDDLQRRRSVYC